MYKNYYKNSGQQLFLPGKNIKPFPFGNHIKKILPGKYMKQAITWKNRQWLAVKAYDVIWYGRELPGMLRGYPFIYQEDARRY